MFLLPEEFISFKCKLLKCSAKKHIDQAPLTYLMLSATFLTNGSDSVNDVCLVEIIWIKTSILEGVGERWGAALGRQRLNPSMIHIQRKG